MLGVLTVLGCTDEPQPPRFQQFDTGLINLPEDDRPHDCAVEWWYYTGHLASRSADRWGFQVTIFKLQDSGGTLYLGNFAVTNHQSGEFYFVEQPWLGDALGEGYALDVAGWQVSGDNGFDTITIPANDYELRLSLVPTKGAVAHGDRGVIGAGGNNATFYYSRPRLDAQGTLIEHGQQQEVSGTVWMDHQWFEQPVELGDLQWDWFALSLDDGVDLMLGVLRAPGGDFGEGTWIAPSGEGTDLFGTEFQAEAIGEWTNPDSGTTYPSGWRVELPTRELSLEVTPVLLNQELHGLRLTPQDYWEGEVHVEGTHNGRPVTGRGYVELTGYAGQN